MWNIIDPKYLKQYDSREVNQLQAKLKTQTEAIEGLQTRYREDLDKIKYIENQEVASKVRIVIANVLKDLKQLIEHKE